MSENVTETTPTETEPNVDEQPAKEATTDWKAEARKWEQRAKENTAAAKRLQDLEDSQKTELEKAAARAEAAEAALAAKEAEATRLSIASKHGISGDYLDLLVGVDETELEAKAQKIAALITVQQETPAGPTHLVVPGEGKTPPLALNSDGLEDALKSALGIA